MVPPLITAMHLPGGLLKAHLSILADIVEVVSMEPLITAMHLPGGLLKARRRLQITLSRGVQGFAIDVGVPFKERTSPSWTLLGGHGRKSQGGDESGEKLHVRSTGYGVGDRVPEL